MKVRLTVLAVLFVTLAVAQFPRFPTTTAPERDTLPNGKSRKLELIKDDHQKSLEDVAAIIRLAEELEAELQENTEHVVSLDSMRKAEEIEDLSKKLQKRMKRIY